MAEKKEQKDNKKKQDLAVSTKEDKQTEVRKNASTKDEQPEAKKAPVKPERKFTPKRGRRGGPRGNDSQDEYEQRILDIARVTRVMAGGKRMRFRACIVLGNKKGKVAIGLAKGADVTIAVTKAVNQAKKNFIEVPIINDTIPHEIYHKLGAAKILFKPARKGKGVIAGGVVRVILELAGIKNITSKILGTNNKVNNAKCVIAALSNLKKVEVKKEDKKSTNNKPEKKEKETKKIKK